MPKTIEVDVSRRMPVPAEAVWALLEDLTPDGVTVARTGPAPQRRHGKLVSGMMQKRITRSWDVSLEALERLAQAGGDARG